MTHRVSVCTLIIGRICPFTQVARAKNRARATLAASYEAYAAVREALFGNTTEARERAAAALALSTGRYTQYEVAIALAWTGDVARAQALADDLNKRFPASTAVQFRYLPTIRAQLALDLNEASKAIEAGSSDCSSLRTGDTGQLRFFIRTVSRLPARSGVSGRA